MVQYTSYTSVMWELETSNAHRLRINFSLCPVYRINYIQISMLMREKDQDLHFYVCRGSLAYVKIVMWEEK